MKFSNKGLEKTDKILQTRATQFQDLLNAALNLDYPKIDIMIARDKCNIDLGNDLNQTVLEVVICSHASHPNLPAVIGCLMQYGADTSRPTIKKNWTVIKFKLARRLGGIAGAIAGRFS